MGIRRISRFVLVGAAIAALASGCSQQTGYFPLEEGHAWTYSVHADLAFYVESVKVVRRSSVAGVNGYELSGPLGFSRVAWKNGVLFADALPNTGVSPALPLLVPDDPNTLPLAAASKETHEHKPVRRWRGFVEVLGRKTPAKALLVQEEGMVKLGSRMAPALKATLTLQMEGKTIELDTSYVDGMGPVHQEQLTNGYQDVSMDFIVTP